MGKKPASVGIVLAAYNSAEFLERAVHSVQAQTCKDWQLVIVDDASTDDTYAIACRLAADDARIVALTYEENRGREYARQHGLEHLDTQWVTYLDHDDAFDPRWCRTMLKTARRHPGYVMYGCNWEFYRYRPNAGQTGEFEPTGRTMFHETELVEVDFLTHIRGWAQGWRIWMNGTIIDRAWFMGIGGYSFYGENIGDDILPALSILHRGTGLRIPQVLYHHTRGVEGQGSSLSLDRLWEKNITYYTLFLEKEQLNADEKEAMQAEIRKMQRFIESRRGEVYNPLDERAKIAPAVFTDEAIGKNSLAGCTVCLVHPFGTGAYDMRVHKTAYALYRLGATVTLIADAATEGTCHDAAWTPFDYPLHIQQLKTPLLRRHRPYRNVTGWLVREAREAKRFDVIGFFGPDAQKEAELLHEQYGMRTAHDAYLETDISFEVLPEVGDYDGSSYCEAHQAAALYATYGVASA
ncbi:MAG: glycosyltransferase family 2 protein [Coriobacteriia bacterium]|nr:glycosyltransferase family 2 protein [Coriobacteriia bacterium]